ncbi:MAG: hypothetical protein F6K31_35445 [Symploca sp. SIO2G7]|nr:hypothetical protein [Symploca sp. SIO2G7]
MQTLDTGLARKRVPTLNAADIAVELKTKIQANHPRYLLLYIRSLEELGGKHWEHGEIAGAIIGEDFSVIKDLGSVFQPNPDKFWQSHRLLAGGLRSERKDSLYFFYGGSPNHPYLLDESIGFAKGKMTDDWKFEWEEPQLLEFSEWEKHYDYSHESNFPDELHHQWRDPYVVFHQGKYWMFVSAAAKTNSELYKGCIGLAVADHPEGPYTALPSPVFPKLTTDQGEEGIFYECERSHVHYHQGMWHLFFCAWRRRVNQNWLKQVDQGGTSISDSTLYHYISPQIQGPYFPAANLPIVKGSSETGFFAINFVETQPGELVAYGSNLNTTELDISGQWQVFWNNNNPEIKRVGFSERQHLAGYPQKFRQPGYLVWDAMLGYLPV